ncbi:UNVERIFIED_CONTAM: putative mitochondrial protein [Sesamum radiatum]|uniref:Mitochondrial protein n=1 Tax=Sesamum radiatum TaxID=300843 RepID=A0AAW2IIR5_SESRA
MSHFRHISLCNITYKIASKVLANRLKPLLPTIIFKSQSAFIPGRLITDNVLVAYEINHYLAHKYGGKAGYTALKLDLSKAYDRVEWIFLERVMLRLEVLSHLISRAEESGDIWGVAVSCRGPRVSHLLFADDTLIFCQASLAAFQCVERLLDQFEKASGLIVNLEKLSVVFSHNTSIDLREMLAWVLGVQVVNRHEKYLGLSAAIGRSKKSLMANFLWHNKGVKKIHWLAWDKVCVRREEGGLGLRKLYAFNRAMLAKQLWRMIDNPNSLISRIWKQRYYPSTNWQSVTVSVGCSFTWRSVLASRDVISTGMRWKIGSGQNVKIWSDRWIPRPLTFQVITTPNKWFGACSEMKM